MARTVDLGPDFLPQLLLLSVRGRDFTLLNFKVLICNLGTKNYTPQCG